MSSGQGRAAAVLVALLMSAPVLAQQPGKAIESGIFLGQAIRNYPDFPELKGPAVLVNAKYTKALRGQKNWHRYYRYPWFGVQAIGGSLGNDGVLGYFAGAMPDMRIPIRLNDRFTFSPVLSIGAAWFSKPYDEVTNPDNFLIGSSITFLASAAAELSYHIGPKTDVLLTGSIVHASNSHFQLPNVGLNMPVLGAGLRFYLNSEKDTVMLPVSEEPTVNHKPAFNIRVSLGMNEQGDSQGPVNGPKYPILLASVFTTMKLSPVNKVKAGIEAWYNSGVYDYIISQEFYDQDEKKRSCAVALIFGHEFLLGHFGVVTDVGLYLYNEFYQDKFKTVENQSFREELKTYIPARMGFQYYLKDATMIHRNNLFVGIYIKSNMGQADFLETGLGYTF